MCIHPCLSPWHSELKAETLSRVLITNFQKKDFSRSKAWAVSNCNKENFTIFSNPKINFQAGNQSKNSMQQQYKGRPQLKKSRKFQLLAESF